MKCLSVDTITYIMKGDFLMKSFCIKTNHKNIIHCLLKDFSKTTLDSVYLSNRQFKNYENVIIHYTGKNNEDFYELLCTTLTNLILALYENTIMRKMIDFNYFYFSSPEKKEIFENCQTFLQDSTNIENHIRKEHLYHALLHYVCENKSMVLDGFICFRLKNYRKILDYIVDSSVNNFLIEKEYNEFIDLLKMYINSQAKEASLIDCVHLIYRNGESTLLDEEKNSIPITENISNARFLSDISFSSNDYALNTLLTLLPQRIIIHEIDKEDEFIQTLKLIFDRRILICTNCNLCETYKMAYIKS